MRWIVPAAGLVLVVVLFVVLKPGGSSDGSSPTPSAGASGTGGPSADAATVEVTVANGAVDGPGTFAVTQGEQVDVIVHADVSDEVHVHGYDLHGDVTPESPASITFTADAPGVFEVELESAGLLLFELEVSP
jgi:hypothetical protein